MSGADFKHRDAVRVKQLGQLRDQKAVIVEAVRAYATVGEICNVLRGVFGQYRGVVKI